MSRPNLARKSRRDSERRAQGRGRREKVDGECDYADCTINAKVKQECLTCERQGKKAHVVRACDSHAAWCVTKMKRHALVAHPINMISAVVGQLAGKDVF